MIASEQHPASRRWVVPSDSDTTKMYASASAFLQRRKWCGAIRQGYVGIVHPGIVAVFLFEIIPNSKDADNWIWVIIGDLPPAYTASDDCSTPAATLDGYVGEMELWVSAVQSGQPVEDLIPVTIDPTQENARRLDTRLRFLNERILPLYPLDDHVD